MVNFFLFASEWDRGYQLLTDHTHARCPLLHHDLDYTFDPCGDVIVQLSNVRCKLDFVNKELDLWKGDEQFSSRVCHVFGSVI